MSMKCIRRDVTNSTEARDNTNYCFLDCGLHIIHVGGSLTGNGRYAYDGQQASTNIKDVDMRRLTHSARKVCAYTPRVVQSEFAPRRIAGGDMPSDSHHLNVVSCHLVFSGGDAAKTR